MSFSDFLFGGTENDNLLWQDRKYNENVERVDAILNRSRKNAFDLFQKGDTRAAQAYDQAIDLARQTPIRQNIVLAQGAKNAQQNLLSGMDEYRRAIMGLPSRFDGTNLANNPPGLTPRDTGRKAAQKLFSGVSTPFFINKDINYWNREKKPNAVQPEQVEPDPAQGFSRVLSFGGRPRSALGRPFSESILAQALSGGVRGPL